MDFVWFRLPSLAAADVFKFVVIRPGFQPKGWVVWPGSRPHEWHDAQGKPTTGRASLSSGASSTRLEYPLCCCTEQQMLASFFPDSHHIGIAVPASCLASDEQCTRFQCQALWEFRCMSHHLLAHMLRILSCSMFAFMQGPSNSLSVELVSYAPSKLSLRMQIKELIQPWRRLTLLSIR